VANTLAAGQYSSQDAACQYYLGGGLMKNIAKAIKKILYLLIIMTTPGFCLALDHIVISEVLYDPVGTETGGEAVEIYNPTEYAIDISGYLLKTESSAADATIPSGTMLSANSFYLIADAGWSTLRDNTSWPTADHEEAITMSNTDSGAGITHPNGTIIDAVGWGNAAGINAGLYEATPSVQVIEGKSLRRQNINADTDNNNADFLSSEPDLQNSTTALPAQNTSGGQSLTLNVDVQNNAPTINAIILSHDDDNATMGTRVSPVPEGIKSVIISTQVTDPDGNDGITSVIAFIKGPDSQKTVVLTKISTINSTTSAYNGTLQMQFYETSGKYNITVTASDSGTNATMESSFDYLSMTAISIDAGSLQFSGAKIGATNSINGDFALSTANAPTIRNTGNTVIDIGIYGTDLADGTKNIPVNNIKYSFDNDFGSDLSGILSKTLQIANLGLENSEDSVVGLGFQLFIPQTTQNGNYTGQVTIVATSEV
jgi:hypothetical protein